MQTPKPKKQVNGRLRTEMKGRDRKGRVVRMEEREDGEEARRDFVWKIS
jgi:hypothetical protein